MTSTRNVGCHQAGEGFEKRKAELTGGNKTTVLHTSLVEGAPQKREAKKRIAQTRRGKERSRGKKAGMRQKAGPMSRLRFCNRRLLEKRE